jgi:ribonuclease inhibitor
MEMNLYQIDCAALTDRDTMHDILARELCLPLYYGRNLDALYDCLTEFPPCSICLQHVEALSALGAYGNALLATLRDAAEANPLLNLIEGKETDRFEDTAKPPDDPEVLPDEPEEGVDELGNAPLFFEDPD